MTARLEHANITVSDIDRTAGYLNDIFGWEVRWDGASIHNGRSVHIGTGDQYVALYTGPGKPTEGPSSYTTIGGINHLGVVVDDLDATEQKVKDAGFEPHSHADYEPGRRFYFHDHDGVEIECVEYDA